jgi:predicted nucleic acid-binding protein
VVIVDTSAWIDYLNKKSTPQAIWLLHNADQEIIGLTTLSLTEILQGISSDKRFREIASLLRWFPIMNPTPGEIALKAAQNYRILRDRGITIRSTIDCLTATYCIEYNHKLLHGDRDFEAFEKHLGLRVVHPPSIPAN